MMNRSQLTEFFCLPSCEAQEQFEELEMQAINYATENDFIMAGECMQKAARIAQDTLEAVKQGKRTDEVSETQHDDSDEFMALQKLEQLARNRV